MITISAANARVKRQKIAEFAGDSYVSPDNVVKRIMHLKSFKDQQFLFGIYQSEAVWVALSVSDLFTAYDGKIEVLRLDTETAKVLDHYRKNDFSSVADLVDGRRVWMGSPTLCQLILNVMLMLQDIPHGTVLE
ncbi:hypothetical protein ACJJI4_12935 [Microbulbifer sp. TRSA002]|uniref:hypothetical protein n=1 Tax=Microbulbifer sp. TRSA002 TaxID=3243382 RepID=UPI00403A190A